MRIAVCDDESEIRDDIAQKIRRFLPEAEICLFESAEHFLMEKSMPDILFLDIKMDGMSGMDLAGKLRSLGINITIVFLTRNPPFSARLPRLRRVFARCMAQENQMSASQPLGFLLRHTIIACPDMC